MAAHRSSHAPLAINDAVVSRLAQQDNVPWYKKPNLRRLYLLMFPACFGVEIAGGFEVAMLNGLQAVPSWLEHFHYPRSSQLGFMSAAYPLGGIAAILLVSSVVDKFGRRYSILLGSTLMIIGAFLQGAALIFLMFIIARFAMGFGSVFAIVASSSLVGELSHPKERAVMSSLFNVGFMVGSISAAGVTLATYSIPNNWAWRIPSFLLIVPCLLQASLISFVPESPRWLISKGRGDEAYAILVKYHAEDDEGSEFVEAEYTQIEQTLAEERKNAQKSWNELLSSPGMRKRVLIASFLGLFTKWSGHGLISFYLPPVLDTIGIHDNRSKNIIHLSMAIWNLVNGTFFALTVPRYPRRRVYLVSAISILVVFTAWTAASAEYAQTRSLLSSKIVLALIFLYSPAYNAGFSSLTYTSLVELFPFHVRAKGITIHQWWTRISGVVTQFVDPIGINSLGWKYYLIYCVWIALGVVFVYVMFPETSGRTLEEVTFLFESERGQGTARHADTEPLLGNHRRNTGAFADMEDA